MNRVIWLAEGQAKCTGSVCRNPKPCARRDVKYTMGRPLADYSPKPPFGPADCQEPDWKKWADPAAKPPEVKPQAREWIGR